MPDRKSDPAVDKAEERRELWNELPDPIAVEDTSAAVKPGPVQPDLVADPEHEFMIRHAGG